MRIRLEKQLPKPISLGVSYNHALESAFYSRMGETIGYSNLHDGDYYKLFTFGPIEGKYTYDKKNKRICFSNSISMEFRTIDEQIVVNVFSNIRDNGFLINDYHLSGWRMKIDDYVINRDEIIIKQKTPICMYITEMHDEKKFTAFMNPKESRFYEGIYSNFEKKFFFATGEKPDSSLKLELIDLQPKDKCLMHYKGEIIEAYKGIYRLKGKPEYLSFLYNVGIGGKNSCGFGMFDVI